MAQKPKRCRGARRPHTRRKDTADADPERRLREALVERGSLELAARIPRGTGSELHRYLRRRLANARVDDLEAEVEDVFSEVILKILGRFDRRGADDIRGVGWLYEVAKSALSVLLAKRAELWALGIRVDADSRDPAAMERLLNGDEAIDPTGGGDGEMLRTLAHALREALSPRELEVLVYSLGEHLDTERIARKMNLKPRSVGTLRAQALRKLRNYLLRANERRK